MREIAGSGDRQELPVNGEQQHEDQTQPESRHDLSQHGKTCEQVIQHGAAIDHAQDAQGETGAHRQQECGCGELQRIRQPQCDQPSDLDALSIGDAEVAVQGTGHIGPILREHRLIKSQRVAQLLSLLRCRVPAGDQPDRIATRVADDEREKGDAEQHGQRAEQLAERE